MDPTATLKRYGARDQISLTDNRAPEAENCGLKLSPVQATGYVCLHFNRIYRCKYYRTGYIHFQGDTV
jgi:hypothetical protein